MKLVFWIFFLIICSPAIAQDDNNRPKRDSFTLIMPVSKETFYQSHIQSVPFVVGPNILQLCPGESVFIEVEQKDGLITGIKSVKQNKNRDKTLEISFVQQVENEKHSNMVLKVKNPFKKDLLYEAVMRTMNTGNWIKTWIMPVKAQLIGIEIWSEVIVSIALTGWKFQ